MRCISKLPARLSSHSDGIQRRARRAQASASLQCSISYRTNRHHSPSLVDHHAPEQAAREKSKEPLAGSRRLAIRCSRHLMFFGERSTGKPPVT